MDELGKFCHSEKYAHYTNLVTEAEPVPYISFCFQNIPGALERRQHNNWSCQEAQHALSKLVWLFSATRPLRNFLLFVDMQHTQIKLDLVDCLANERPRNTVCLADDTCENLG